MICPYCQDKMLLRDSDVIYRRSYGMAWVCKNYPQCDVYVTCHPGTSIPKGTPADRTLRLARLRAHAAFDPVWKSRRMKRANAYRWMAEALGIPLEQAHIGMLDERQCQQLVRAVHERKAILL